jgi:hypothetical protein
VMNQLLDPHQIFSHELIGAYLAIVLTLVALVIVWYYEERDRERPTVIIHFDSAGAGRRLDGPAHEAVVENHEVDWDWPDRKQFPYDHERKRPDWLHLTSQ